MTYCHLLLKTKNVFHLRCDKENSLNHNCKNKKLQVLVVNNELEELRDHRGWKKSEDIEQPRLMK